jgi:hypothetical protein
MHAKVFWIQFQLGRAKNKEILEENTNKNGNHGK